MNNNSYHKGTDRRGGSADRAPILIVPYMWIGDFVRCHTVVNLLRERFPDRPVDMLATTLCAPLADYMPGLRQAVVVDLPRGRLALAQQLTLAKRLKAEGYGTALIMPRTWKSGLAPFLAGIPERTGFLGEARFILLNDLRFGERRLPRMVDRCATLALPPGAAPPAEWPLPQLKVPAAEVASWRSSRGLAGETRPIVVLAPGAVGPSKRWTARRLCGARPPASGRRPRGLGGGRSRREGACRRDCRRHRGPRSHRQRSARCHSRARRRFRGGLQRFRPAPRRRSRWALPRSAFSARQARGIGRRSIRWRRRSRPRASSTAGPATGRYAASATTAACARSAPRRSSPPPAARLKPSLRSADRQAAP